MCPQIRIRRDFEVTHRWVIVVGDHETTTPWEDDANAVQVILWLKAKANGAVNVVVES